VKCAQGMKVFPSTGKNFMGVCLVPHIPDHFIVGRIEHIMDSDGKFNSTKACAKVAGVNRDHIDDELPYLSTELWQLIHPEFSKVFRIVDMRE